MVFTSNLVRFIFIVLILLSANRTNSQQLDSISANSSEKKVSLPFWFEMGFGGIRKTAWWNFGCNVPIRNHWIVSTNFMIANRDPYHILRNYNNHTNSKTISFSVGSAKELSPHVKLVISGGPALNISKKYYYVLSRNKPAKSTAGIFTGANPPIETEITSWASPAVTIHAQILFHSQKSGFGIHPYLVVSSNDVFGGFTCNYSFWK